MTPRAVLEPKKITATRYVCPGCHRSWARRESTVAHMKRCWKNPDNRACKSCVHLDLGRCCAGASNECGCNGQDAWECDLGVALVTGSPVVNCPLWAAGGLP